MESVGVSVVPLFRLHGFKSMYQRMKELYLVPRKELLIFSHQDLAKKTFWWRSPKFTPKYCELDPIATAKDVPVATTKDEFKAT